MILVNLDRSSRTPLYMQIMSQVKTLIENGSLPISTILPSTRSFAQQLGVNRSTVYRAYEELWALGYIDGRPGSYSRVRERPHIKMEGEPETQGLIDWGAVAAPACESVFEAFTHYRPEGDGSHGEKIIDLSRLAMDPRILPVESFRKSMNRVLHREGHRVMNYAEYAGYRPLRKYIAQRLRIHGIAVSEEEILITNGSQHALDLIIRLLAIPGRPVVVESPTYALLLPLLRLHGATIISIPMQKDGVDIGILEGTLAKHVPAFVYTMPNFHNPTGISTTQAHREALLELCQRHRVPLVEDGFEEEMKYFGKVTLPIKSMDAHHMVLYLGTFSKVLMPGVRIGWIAAHRFCIRRLLSMKRFSDISSNSLTQAAVYEFCREGWYDLHIRRMHRTYRKRMQAALQALKDQVSPNHLSWTEPNGGYLIWGQMPGPLIPLPEFQAVLNKHGLLVSPGEFYFAEKPKQTCFRLSISALSEDEITEGMRRLGNAMKELSERGKDHDVA